MIRTIATRLSYGITAITFLGMALIFLTGTPKLEYRVTFGNAAAAEVIEARASQKNLDDMAQSGAVTHTLRQKAKQVEAEDAKNEQPLKPGKKPSVRP